MIPFRFFLFSFISYLSLIVPFAVAQEPKGLSVPKKESTTKKDPALDQYYVANAAFNRKLYPVAVSQFEAFLKKILTIPRLTLLGRDLPLAFMLSNSMTRRCLTLMLFLRKRKLTLK